MKKRPNILLLVSDQHRGDWMPYDDETRQRLGTSELLLQMPNIRRMMDDGTSFTCAQSPAPLCAPARACLASGRRYRDCRVFNNNQSFDCRIPTFYRILKETGYQVLGAGKFDLTKSEHRWGDGFHETLKQMGFTAARDSEGKYDAANTARAGHPGPYCTMLKKAGYMETYIEDIMGRKANSDYPTPLPDEYYADNWVTKQSLEMLEEAETGSPWFMQVNFSGPHNPWDITVSMKEAVKDRIFPEAACCPFAEENRKVRQNYAAMIENIDRNIGLLIDEVRQRGELDNTLIIYTADHGEMMGDHGKYCKTTPEQGSVHIPLVIDASRLDGQKGKQNLTPVELQDLASTILDYAGCDTSDMKDSVSLRKVVNGTEAAARTHAVSELLLPFDGGIIRSFGTVTDGRFRLLMESSMPDRLFDLRQDPFEERNLAVENPEIVSVLKKQFADRKNP